MITLPVTFLLLAGVAAAAETSKKCERTVVDTCSGSLLMLGDRNFVFPHNLEAMNARCRSLKTLEKCVKEYTQNCMSKTAKQSISVLVYSVAKTNKGYCSTRKRKLAMLGVSKCAGEHKAKLDGFMDIMTREFHGIRTYKDSKLRLPLACCSYYKFKHNLVEHIQQHCPTQVTEMEALIDGYAHDILNLVCGEYTEDSDKCKTIVAKTPKWKKALESKNFVLPLADIFDSL